VGVRLKESEGFERVEEFEEFERFRVPRLAIFCTLSLFYTLYSFVPQSFRFLQSGVLFGSRDFHIAKKNLNLTK
jgi:hypothetical protein